MIDRFMPGGALDLDALATLPTIFLQETSGQPDQVARVGTITRARIDGRDIVLDYTYDLGIPPVPNKVLQGFATDLEIKEFQFSRTHWSIKDSDLYRALLKHLPPRRQQTKVFQLAEFENIEPSVVSAMMPFHPHFDAVYAALRRTAEMAGLKCRRACDIWENPAVIQAGIVILVFLSAFHRTRCRHSS